MNRPTTFWSKFEKTVVNFNPNVRLHLSSD
jgi:hypothetical protein